MLSSGGAVGPGVMGRVGFRLGAGLLSGLICGACAHSAPAPALCEQPPALLIRLDASERLNPDEQGRSLPTNIQVIQLKDARRFDAAEFQDLWQRPKDVLEEDLLASDELTLEPGQGMTREVSRSAKAEYIAVMGVFRRPAGQAWRAVARIPRVMPEDCDPASKTASRGAPLRFLIEDYRIESRVAEVRR
ncbi:type VI secretion system lipoprotein TssJ [Corallococcus sp. AB038B]|nr:type VI secretion system lipoprotein TssJ [Corallococcus sp. AB038B]